MYLAWRHRATYRRFVANAVAAVLASIAVIVPTLHGQAVPVAVPAPNARADLWQPFDAAALREMVAQGHVVFVDVTAAWCLTCKVNELAVLNREPVTGKLRGAGVVAMRADWTQPDPNITAYLQSFGRYGVPFNVVYGPGAPEGIVLLELLTPDVVMDALRRADVAPSHQQEATE
jgi:suppressor for copper-sensitivity B